jgi:Holliday junction resolvase RusA-like endonuclease
MPYEFTVYADPKGQPRARASRRGSFVHMYTPNSADSFKKAIKLAAKEAGLYGKMLTGPLRLEMRAFFARPKSHFFTGKRSNVLRPNAPRWHTIKPDADNIFKCSDALTRCGVWKDDCQISEGLMTKEYTSDEPRTEIKIECLN